jgi:hypothetical protein
VREIWFDWLRQYRPDLLERYERLYSRGAYLPSAERERLAALARGKGRPRRFNDRADRGRRRTALGSDDGRRSVQAPNQPHLF